MPAPARRPTSSWRASSSAADATQPSSPLMSLPPKPRGLGRGLSALLGDDEVAAAVTPAPPPPPSPSPSQEEAPAPAARPAPARAPLTLPIGQLKAGRMQPRTTFEDMDALVVSVKEFGLLQPILVRPVAGQP